MTDELGLKIYTYIDLKEVDSFLREPERACYITYKEKSSFGGLNG